MDQNTDRRTRLFGYLSRLWDVPELPDDLLPSLQSLLGFCVHNTPTSDECEEIFRAISRDILHDIGPGDDELSTARPHDISPRAYSLALQIVSWIAQSACTTPGTRNDALRLLAGQQGLGGDIIASYYPFLAHLQPDPREETGTAIAARSQKDSACSIVNVLRGPFRATVTPETRDDVYRQARQYIFELPTDLALNLYGLTAHTN